MQQNSSLRLFRNEKPEGLEIDSRKRSSVLAHQQHQIQSLYRPQLPLPLHTGQQKMTATQPP